MNSVILSGYHKKLSDWLKSKPLSDNWSQVQVQFKTGEDLDTGTVVGKVTATELYVKCNTAASDGSQTALGILRDPVKANATAATGTTGAATTLVTYTANELGLQGNTISIALVDPAANSATLSCAVTGDAQTGQTITISLATGAGGLVTTTSGDIPTIIAATPAAAALVTAVDGGNDTDVLASATVTLTGGTYAQIDNNGVIFTKLTGMVIIFSKLTYAGTAATVRNALIALGATMAEE